MSLTEIMSSMGLEFYPILGLIIFLVVFLAIVRRVMRRDANVDMDHMAHAPMFDSMMPTHDGGSAGDSPLPTQERSIQP